jgi:membrane protein implicated in regulation of membrane protease activity
VYGGLLIRLAITKTNVIFTVLLWVSIISLLVSHVMSTIWNTYYLVAPLSVASLALALAFLRQVLSRGDGHKLIKQAHAYLKQKQREQV